MTSRTPRALRLGAAGFLAVMIGTTVAGPASAQGLFEMLFGGLRRHVERPANAFVEPFSQIERALTPDRNDARRAEASGPSRGFCVRTCDGRFFPVQAAGRTSAAEMCRSFCPASETQVYSGSTIEYATTSNGSRYTDLKTAYRFREQMVSGCTCNGRDSYGLAKIEPKDDPTLRQGDVVVTREGLVAYSGTKNDTAHFTPVESYGKFSSSYREKLSELKLMPPTPGTTGPGMSSNVSTGDRSRSAQLDR